MLTKQVLHSLSHPQALKWVFRGRASLCSPDQSYICHAPAFASYVTNLQLKHPFQTTLSFPQLQGAKSLQQKAVRVRTVSRKCSHLQDPCKIELNFSVFAQFKKKGTKADKMQFHCQVPSLKRLTKMGTCSQPSKDYRLQRKMEPLNVDSDFLPQCLPPFPKTSRGL